MNGLNIVFAGTPEFGVPCLNALAESPHRVIAVYTQPDRKAGRGQQLQASPVKQWALDRQIPVYQPLNFKHEDDVAALAQLKPDLMVVIAYGLILPRSVLEIPRLGCINVHASLLPRWRGASPIAQSIIHNDATTGVTIMQMDVGLDTGDMLSTVACFIEPTDTAHTLHDKLAQIAAEPLLNTIELLGSNQATPVKQDDTYATYAKKISKDDARIDWDNPASAIDCQVRGLYPWPVAFTFVNDTVLRIHKASVDSSPHELLPGTVVRLDKKGMLVATKQGGLLVERIQFPGGKVLHIADWLNANKTDLYVGLVLQ